MIKIIISQLYDYNSLSQVELKFVFFNEDINIDFTVLKYTFEVLVLCLSISM